MLAPRPTNLLGTSSNTNSTGAPLARKRSTSISGTVQVTLESGDEVEVDADQYLDTLKAEAEALRTELHELTAMEAAVCAG